MPIRPIYADTTADTRRFYLAGRSGEILRGSGAHTPRGATGEFMHWITRTMRTLLLGTAAAAIFVTTTYGQINDSIRGVPSEANHFIETPKGWVHPKTPWGEPDIAANLNMMQAAGIPLERCAN